MENHDPDDPVAVYIREVGNVEPLTKQEETRLFRELGGCRDWDEQKENVARRLIESQLMLVVTIAERYRGAGVPMLDLIQYGNIGLMNSVRIFAERQSEDFTAYASVCIADAIAKAIGESK